MEKITETEKKYFLKWIENSKKIYKGLNEVTKSIEKELAEFVLIAENVVPAELVLHIPHLCIEKKIPSVTFFKMKELGQFAKLPVKAATISISGIVFDTEKEKDVYNKFKVQK